MLASRPQVVDPAADAVQFLCRVALIILFVLAPAAELVAHGALYVLLPVGAVILLIAGRLSGDLRHHDLGVLLKTPIGIAALFLVFWAGLSLIWTPYPDEAGARFGKALATGVVVLLAIAALPERTRVADLYLIPIGVAFTATATSLVILFGPASFWSGSNPDYTLAQRCLLSVSILLWPALGVLVVRERWLMAVGLVFVVTAAALADFLQIALAALAIGAVVYAVAMTQAVRTARVFAFLFAFLLLMAPMLALGILLLAGWMQLPPSESLVSLANATLRDWPRLITGHGFGFVPLAIEVGALPADTPRSVLFTVWYELGVLGAVAFAILGLQVFLAVGRAPQLVAPPLLAGLVAGLTIALWGAETTQLWWMTLNGIDAIAFALLFRGHRRARRPAAPGRRGLQEHDLGEEESAEENTGEEEFDEENLQGDAELED